MPIIRFNNIEYACTATQSVLDVLLEHNLPIPSSCRSGLCQTCLMQSTSGKPPAASQTGLKETLREQNYFLACSCYPKQDMDIRLPDSTLARMKARVKNIEKLSPDVLSICLESEIPVNYKPGQYINLFRHQALARSYSLASLPQTEDCMQLHIRKVPDGRMTSWIHNELSCGDTIEISQPAGDCFYTPGNSEQPLLLIGTGTGLAPLYGIARDALAQGHRGEIRLYHGSLNLHGLYLDRELRELAAEFPNFRYIPCVSDEAVEDPVIASGHVLDIALRDQTRLSGWRIFLCGNPNMVKAAKKQTFLNGAAMKDIHADAFVPAAG